MSPSPARFTAPPRVNNDPVRVEYPFAPDSMGAYLTFQPGPDTTDADRNCISNIRPDGIGYADAAFKLATCFNKLTARKVDRGLAQRVDQPGHERRQLGGQRQAHGRAGADEPVLGPRPLGDATGAKFNLIPYGGGNPTYTVETLRGLEGNAARQYFGVFEQMILQQKEDFAFDERSRRPVGEQPRLHGQVGASADPVGEDHETSSSTSGTDAPSSSGRPSPSSCRSSSRISPM